MLNEVIHRHVHAQKHLIWMQSFWQLKYMKPLICLKYNRSRRRRTLLRIFNPFIHGFATRVSRCPTFHPLSPVPHMSQCPTFWLAIVFRSYWHAFLKSGFCSMAVKRKKWMAVIMVMCFVFYKRIKWSSGQPQVQETIFGFWLFDQLVLTSLLATGAFNKSLKISNINGSLATSDICPLWKQRRLILSPHEVKTKKKWEMFGLSVYMVISWMNPHNPTHNPLQWKILAAVLYLSPYPSYLMVE